MSGGHWDYQQSKLLDIAEDLEELIKQERDGVVDEYGFSYEFSEDTLKSFERGSHELRLAYIYMQRIDWLLSGDDSEKTYHERLKEDLTKYYEELGGC